MKQTFFSFVFFFQNCDFSTFSFSISFGERWTGGLCFLCA